MNVGIEIQDVASSSIPAVRTRRAPSTKQPANIPEFGIFMCRCPNTRDQIDSGIEMDRRTFRRIGGFRLRLRCRCCGETHLIKVSSGELSAHR